MVYTLQIHMSSAVVSVYESQKCGLLSLLFLRTGRDCESDAKEINADVCCRSNVSNNK